MIPVHFPQAYSKPLGAGDNPNTGDLPRCVAIQENTPGVCASVSCWEPSEEELADIIKNKRVYIAVMRPLHSPTQPPVWVLGQNPFNNGVFKRVHEEDVKHLGEGPGSVL